MFPLWNWKTIPLEKKPYSGFIPEIRRVTPDLLIKT